MKKIKYILLSGMLFSMASCEFLDTTPSDFIDPEAFYSNETEIAQALAGVYSSLSSEKLYGAEYSVLAQTDDLGYYWRNTTPVGVFNNNYSTSESSVYKMWAELYSGIMNANMLLAKLEDSPVDASVKTVAEGEAKALRAHFYFLLAQCWGDVPMPKNLKADLGDVQIDLEQTSQKEVLHFVVKELEDAYSKVKDIEKAVPGHITKSAVSGLLMRVNLKLAGWPIYETAAYEEVVRWGDSIQSKNYHELNPDYAQVFINLASDVYDPKESIWEVEFKGNRADAHQQTGRIGNAIGIQNTDVSKESEGYSYGFISSTLNLWDLYRDIDGDGKSDYEGDDATEFVNFPDVRRDWNIAPYSFKEGANKKFVKNYLNSKGQPQYDGKGNVTDKIAAKSVITSRNAGKFRREYEVVTPRDKNNTPINFPIIRYADVLLMLAEAENEVHQAPTQRAIDCLNQVRVRAKVPAVNGTDYESFKNLIKDERGRELCFEALRKYDLIRWNDYRSQMSKVANYVSADERWSVGDNYAVYYAKNGAASERYMWLPIPTRELGLNKLLKQNAAWQ
ncbi:MAG: RagB/SusD family nutrient uptake outer membrane protein [Bacteroidales bacterium]